MDRQAAGQRYGGDHRVVGTGLGLASGSAQCRGDPAERPGCGDVERERIEVRFGLLEDRLAVRTFPGRPRDEGPDRQLGEGHRRDEGTSGSADVSTRRGRLITVLVSRRPTLSGVPCILAARDDEEDDMCWTCDHPGTTQADFYDHMMGLIDRYGWALQYVEPHRDRPPFAYTLGLTLLGRPELVATGLPDHRVGSLLNDAAATARRDGPPSPGERLLVAGWRVEVVELTVPDAHLHTAVGMFGPDTVRAVQLAWADGRGRWPWERGHRGGQPVLGVREADR